MPVQQIDEPTLDGLTLADVLAHPGVHNNRTVCYRVGTLREWQMQERKKQRPLNKHCGHAYTHQTQPKDYKFCPWCGGEHVR